MLRIASTTRRFNSTEAAPTNPKIAEIVDQISRLTLLETADLVSSLKVGFGVLWRIPIANPDLTLLIFNV